MVQGGWSVWKGTFFRGSEIWDGSRRRVRVFKGRDEGGPRQKRKLCEQKLECGGMQHRNRQVPQAGQVGETSGKVKRGPKWFECDHEKAAGKL